LKPFVPSFYLFAPCHLVSSQFSLWFFSSSSML
jgi:hypothetical protein